MPDKRGRLRNHKSLWNDQTKEFARLIHLCDTCKYATPLMCDWISRPHGDTTPPDGYGMSVAAITTGQHNHLLTKITRCARYSGGRLPKIGKTHPGAPSLAAPGE